MRPGESGRLRNWAWSQPCATPGGRGKWWRQLSKRILSILSRFLPLALIGLVAGCALDGTSRKEFVKGNMIALAHKNPLGAFYFSVDVGSPSAPYDGQPRLVFELFGERISSDALDVDSLKKRARVVRPASTYDSRWGNGDEEILVGPYIMVFRGQRLMRFEATVTHVSDAETWYPAIGTPDATKLHRFPLRESEVIEIFGKPDGTNSSFQW